MSSHEQEDIQEIKRAVNEASDEPLRIQYKNGEVVQLPSWKSMMEDQLALEAEADKILDSLPPEFFDM